MPQPSIEPLCSPRLLPRWLSPVWLLAGITMVLLLFLSGFFAWSGLIPITSDINPGMYDTLRFSWPPTGYFATDYWLGEDMLPMGLHVLSIWAWLPEWFFFTGTYAVFTALAVVACYALLRELEFGGAVSGLAALIYAWQGEVFSTILAGHFPHVIMAPLLPLAMYLVLRSARRRDFLMAALAGACTGMLVSLLQDRGMLCSLFIGALFLVELWQRRRDGWRPLLGAITRLALVVSVAGAIAAPALSSVFTTYVTGIETPGAESPEQKYHWATQWSYAPEELFTHAVPGLFGWRNGSASGPYWGRIGQDAHWRSERMGFRNFALANYSLGTIGTLLLIVGIVRLVRPGSRDSPDNLPAKALTYGRFLLVLGVLGIAMAFGRYQPFYHWWLEIPGMDSWRNPLKFLMPANLCLVVVIAAGAQWMHGLLKQRSNTSASRQIVALYWRGAASLLFLTWLASLVTGPVFDANLRSLDYATNEIDQILKATRWALFIAAMVAFAADAAWRFFSEPRTAREQRPENPVLARLWDWLLAPGQLGRGFLSVLGVLVIGQMMWVQAHYVDLHPYGATSGPSPFTERLRSHDNPFRVTVDITDPALRNHLSTSFRADDVQSLDIPAASRIPGDYQTWLKALHDESPRRFDLAGVRYLVAAGPVLNSLLAEDYLPLDPETLLYYPLVRSPVPKAPSHGLVGFKKHLKKATVVPGLQVLSTDEAVLKALPDAKWDPRQTILTDQATAKTFDLPPDGRAPLATGQPARSLLVEYSPTRIEVHVSTERPGFLLVNDKYSPHWKATVNGDPAPLFRANYIMRGVPLPAGRSEIIMNYRAPSQPVYIQIGVWILLAAWGMGRIATRKAA